MSEIKEQNWQPIDTAPKDGTRILAVEGCDVYAVEWVDGEGWVYGCVATDWNYYLTIYATCWKPLPEPP